MLEYPHYSFVFVDLVYQDAPYGTLPKHIAPWDTDWSVANQAAVIDLVKNATISKKGLVWVMWIPQLRFPEFQELFINRGFAILANWV